MHSCRLRSKWSLWHSPTHWVREEGNIRRMPSRYYEWDSIERLSERITPLSNTVAVPHGDALSHWWAMGDCLRPNHIWALPRSCSYRRSAPLLEPPSPNTCQSLVREYFVLKRNTKFSAPLPCYFPSSPNVRTCETVDFRKRRIMEVET